MRPVFMHIKADCTDPLVNQPCILAGAEMAHVIDTAWDDKIVVRTSPTVKPLEKGLARLSHDFELDRTLGLLLHDRGPVFDCPTSDDITDLHFYDVTTPLARMAN